MNRAAKTDLLQALRTQLEHFNDSPDFGDAEAVAVIRHHLMLRIHEVEGSLRVRARFGSEIEMHPSVRSEAA